MYATDFEYDNRRLSDYGLTICNFDSSSGVTNASVGSIISFNKVSHNSGQKYSLTSTHYEECYSAVITICKNPCEYDDLEITSYELRELIRWLNRKEFLKFRFIDDEQCDSNYYFDASFNIAKLMVDDIVYGLELTMETNRPFAYGDNYFVKLSITNTSLSYPIENISDEYGYTYPTIKVTCKHTGISDLEITNETENHTTVIKNCVQNEEITINGDLQIIETSVSEHKIYNDFNYEFFKLGNSFGSRISKLKFSIPCEVEISYTPIVKITP